MSELDDDDKALLGMVEISIDLDEFLATPKGRYLQRRAVEVVTEFTKAALGKGYAPQEVEDLRHRAMAARMLMEFIGQGIAEGHTAEHELKARDTE